MAPAPPGPTLDTLLGTLARLSGSMEALAAVAAHLRLAEGPPGDPRIAAQLAEVTRLLGVPGDLAPAERAIATSFVRSFLRQAVDLVERPDRPPGWTADDPIVVESQGRASAVVARIIAGLPEALGLRRALGRPGARFLDVGTGVGWLAIAMARAFPELAVVGLDVSAEVLARARDNVRAEGLDARVTLAAGDVTTLAEERTYDVVWLPGPFLGETTLAVAAARARVALVPGGMVVVGLYGGKDPLETALAGLRTLRSGGHVWAFADLERTLEQAGLETVTEIPPSWPAPIRLVTAMAPGEPTSAGRTS